MPSARGTGSRDAVAAPVIIFFYGGDWQSGYKELYRYVAKALARRGYVAVVPDYRIYPEVCYPDFLDDGAQVVSRFRSSQAFTAHSCELRNR
jgi:acetyl esterase/lipase